METRFEVETSWGPVWLWGRDTGRPVLLMISGAFASADYMHRIQAVHPGADVLRAHLPGNHCPDLAETSIRAFAAAYGEALCVRWPGRPVVVLGVSTGALVALAMRAPEIASVVAVEPPLEAGRLWPLETFRERAPTDAAAFLASVFGIGPSSTDQVSHAWVLDGLAVPTVAIIGSDPLFPERATARMPSLVTDEALRALEAHPSVRIVRAHRSGHDVPRDDGPLLRAWVDAALDDPAGLLPVPAGSDRR